MNALGMAIESGQTEGVMIHSDHGPHYTSWAFILHAQDSKLVQSMGSIGICFNNGVMESTAARIQIRWLNRKRWSTHLEITKAIFEHLETFHSRQRQHSSLQMLGPIEFELRCADIPSRDQAN